MSDYQEGWAQESMREGDERLSGQSDNNGVSAKDKGALSKRKRKSGEKAGSVGRALRTVYDDMLREQIPDDFIDLLGKLS